MSWLNKLLASFENTPGGFSARKLTAFAFTACALYLQVRHGNEHNVQALLIIDASTLLLCLGIVTAEQIIRLKNGKGKE